MSIKNAPRGVFSKCKVQSAKFKYCVAARQVLFTGLPRHLRWLAMTRESVWVGAYLGTERKRFLAFSDHPAAARHPSNGGELGVVLFVIAREHRDRGDPVIIKSRIRAGIIYWIATPSAMARNDKKRCAHNYLDPGDTAPMDDKSVELSTGMTEWQSQAAG